MAETATDIELRIQQERSMLTDPTSDYRVSLPPPCMGCGGQAHGGTTSYMRCLERALQATREANALDRAELHAFRQERARVHKRPKEST